MKRLLFASATLLALVLPQKASADGCDGICLGFGFRVRACFKFNFCLEPCFTPPCGPSYGPACAPWYTHFPHDPHMYQPAPMAMYPNWPQRPQGMPVEMPPVNAQRYAPYSGVQPVNYYGGVPSYWYGR